MPADAIRAALDSLGLPIKLEVEKVKRCGFAATKATVEAADQEDYRFLPDIEAILASGALTPKQRELATAIFRKLAEAEAAVHGMPLERVHFHEVGALDSIADIVGAAVGLDLLGVERFTSSPVPTGTGTVKCAHGLMPVPTPGDAGAAQGRAARAVDGQVRTHDADRGRDPHDGRERVRRDAGDDRRAHRPRRGHEGLPRPHRTSCVCWWAPISSPTAPLDRSRSRYGLVLETNLDDVAPEMIGYCIERLFAAGALDVFAVQMQMKKNRPGFMMSVICEPTRASDLEAILFRETGTFGVRRHTAERSKLEREAITVETPGDR